MNDPKHARLMLDMAAVDLLAIANMGDAQKFADSVFGFHNSACVSRRSFSP
jgi:hypothetical protein